MARKNSFFSSSSLLFLCSLLVGTGTLTGQTRTNATQIIPLHWLGDSIDTVWEPYAALVIPVKLKDCPRQFYMQFDLGAPSSLLYRNKLLSIQSKYPSVLQLKDTSTLIGQLCLQAGKTVIEQKNIAIRQFENDSINWTNPASIEIIGTFGVDLIDGKVAVIDYPGGSLQLSDTLANTSPHLTLSKFIYQQKRILLPATINGQSTLLYFDTGSSMFELLTDKATAQNLSTPPHQPLRYQVNSWGKTLTANSIAAASGITVNNQQLPIRFVTYIEGVNSAQIQQMQQMGIGGMTGNKLFLAYKLVLDTRNQYFGLIPEN
ncbi:hypothetical protein [Flavihumibacter sp. CACIAM 22H1]|uniref:hypothetical protein n=1 Tax=Flavihumibacter sp. CACIAM 22H1 TaxID=1812911 RepID=UPI0007A83683|nr:hypothetical protein [Flavihumibacter sp. CACIAM 22H1]KYP15579.1 MAG: hypothetical protein A1D16_08010 [Flavihumibacter sp. CACIAM 22H1]